MKISIKVYPRSSRKTVVEDGERLKVYVHEAAADGKANDAVCILIAEKFGVPKSRVCIVRGETAREKVIEIN